ncbi:hypothetical protein SFUMM280S_02457 [Streptomyces fumanus]
MLRNADLAMYRAKAGGKGRWLQAAWYRLRRALGTGGYPVPHGPAEPRYPGGTGVYPVGGGPRRPAGIPR